MNARLDHLVVAATRLPEAVAWCEATLGVTPAPGGQHPLMGTHNRLLRIATVDHPQAYLELIAIDSEAAQAAPMRHKRWFDLDSPAMAAHLARHGPSLLHWAAQVPDIDAATARVAALGLDLGTPQAASRDTPRGLLSWRIGVRADGVRPWNGCLPTLIEWGEVHPSASLPACGVTLGALEVRHPREAMLREALAALALTQVAVAAGPARLRAVLHTPLGRVELESAPPDPC